MAWQDTFAAENWTSAFGEKGPDYNPVIGHRGTDLAIRGGGDLPAWERLTVIDSDYFSGNLGYCIILRADDGCTFGVAHGRRGTRANNGEVLEPGDTIMSMAAGPRSLSQSNVDFPGNQWTGSHAHITLTRGQDVFGDVGLMDARPRIIAAVGRDGGIDYGYGLTTAAQRDAQRALTELGFYDGLIDGEFGEKSVEAMQRYLMSIGLLSSSYEPDGIPGFFYGCAVQDLAKQYGYPGPRDGEPGPETSTGISNWANTIMGEVVPPVVVPPLVTPPKWENTYPNSVEVVSSPNREPRATGSNIGFLIVHGTGNLADHTGYFSRENDRDVAPHLYPRPNGQVKEFVRLGERAWTTGVPLDHQAVTVECESDNTSYTDEQYEAVALIAAFMHVSDVIDGIPCVFKISRQTILGHCEVPGVTSGTFCPGTEKVPNAFDYDRLIKRALELVEPVDMVAVPRAKLEQLLVNATIDSTELAGILA